VFDIHLLYTNSQQNPQSAASVSNKQPCNVSIKKQGILSPNQLELQRTLRRFYVIVMFLFIEDSLIFAHLSLCFSFNAEDNSINNCIQNCCHKLSQRRNILSFQQLSIAFVSCHRNCYRIKGCISLLHVFLFFPFYENG